MSKSASFSAPSIAESFTVSASKRRTVTPATESAASALLTFLSFEASSPTSLTAL
jgi:hypothetical protein